MESESLKRKMAKFHKFDVIIIGGGFYGCALALKMSQKFPKVVIVEKEKDILTRASYRNQARVHNGYHYPRSYLTALRSRINFPKFVADYRPAIEKDFTKVYAIAKSGSKVTSRQFWMFCQKIGAPIKPARESIKKLFNNVLIDDVFEVSEYAFNAAKLRAMLKRSLNTSRINLDLGCGVKKVTPGANECLSVHLDKGAVLSGKYVFCCVYSQTNRLLKNSRLPLLPLKNEATEIALISVPDVLKRLGITVMDGPFFSTMPFPDRQLHSLSHVTYTPHLIRLNKSRSNFPYMIRDAQRFLPCLREAKYTDSLYETKTVLPKNEVDDGRPILFKPHYGLKNLFVVLGGKIDNIYDIGRAIDSAKIPD